MILVLVLMVIGALIVLPLMDYAMAVGRTNTVLSSKTAGTEAVKGGLRIALADTPPSTTRAVHPTARPTPASICP